MLHRWITKTQLKKINSALRKGGYGTYPGDSTAAEPDGCGAGYVMNLVNHIAGADPDAKKEVKQIIAEVLE